MPKTSQQKSIALSKDAMEILVAEYNYIAGTAAQANEDRARISSFYLIAVGSLIAALFSAQFLSERFDTGTVNILFCLLFFLLTLLGSTTILQLTRLRVSWFESVLAMNRIKEFMIARETELEGAFKWRTPSLPSFYKMNSVSFLQTVEVSLLSSLTFGAGVFFFQLGIHYNCTPCNWAYTISSGILAFLVHIWMYKRQLGRDHKRLQKELEADHAA